MVLLGPSPVHAIPPFQTAEPPPHPLISPLRATPGRRGRAAHARRGREGAAPGRGGARAAAGGAAGRPRAASAAANMAARRPRSASGQCWPLPDGSGEEAPRRAPFLLSGAAGGPFPLPPLRLGGGEGWPGLCASPIRACPPPFHRAARRVGPGITRATAPSRGLTTETRSSRARRQSGCWPSPHGAGEMRDGNQEPPAPMAAASFAVRGFEGTAVASSCGAFRHWHSAMCLGIVQSIICRMQGVVFISRECSGSAACRRTCYTCVQEFWFK